MDETTTDSAANSDMAGAIADAAATFIADWGLRVVAAILILLIGLWLAKRVTAILKKILLKKEIEETLVHFFGNIAYGLIVILVVIAAIANLGVQTASLVAVVGAAGLAVGLALQGSLSNFASGVLIILFKPFTAGQFVSAGGEMGVVVEVGILATELRAIDNKKIVVPNSAIMGGSITNFSHYETRRVDMMVGVSYRDDLNKAKQIITDVLTADERVLKDPAPQVEVFELGDSSINFVVRPWVNAADYWDLKFAFTQKVKEQFDKEGISIPFPQRDVHLFQEKEA